MYKYVYREGGYFWAELSFLWSRTFIFKERSVLVNRRMDWKGTPFFTVHIFCFLKKKENSETDLTSTKFSDDSILHKSVSCM